MTVATFDLKSAIGLSDHVYIAWREIEHRQIPLVKQRDHFAPGIHCCPDCGGRMLIEKGYSLEGGRLIDASQREDAIRDPAITNAIRKCGLVSDEHLHPSINTTFVIATEPHPGAPNGRRPSFRHNPGHQCETAEHLRLKLKLARVFQDLGLEVETEFRVDGGRRPDLLVTRPGIGGTPPHISAVEVQQSGLAEDQFVERLLDLSAVDEVDSVIWVMKASRMRGGSLRAAAQAGLNLGVPILAYDMEYSDAGGGILRVETVDQEYLNRLDAPYRHPEDGRGRKDCKNSKRSKKGELDWSQVIVKANILGSLKQLQPLRILQSIGQEIETEQRILPKRDQPESSSEYDSDPIFVDMGARRVAEPYICSTPINTNNKTAPRLDGIQVRLGDIVGCRTEFGSSLGQFTDASRVKGWSADQQELLLGWLGCVSVSNCYWVTDYETARFPLLYKPAIENLP
ncbi:hypothetical protein [Halomicronema sp. CCY15110]|uniref:competence protein CoiA family protein n=1 Tax=Halomicronema sp. CCY15110 TaxID=2767773 RepID=UPI00194DAF0B|nr:hypothetical protein [Halomicronema sp. CCY15110]